MFCGLQLHRLTCTCGHSACLHIHGYYQRNIKIRGRILSLRICRVKCSECGRTHAILPSCIVPYSQISLEDQCSICIAYEDKTGTGAVLDGNPCIDENNVKTILRNYRSHWKQRLMSVSITLRDAIELVIRCFAEYSAQFMQIRKTRNILFFNTT